MTPRPRRNTTALQVVAATSLLALACVNLSTLARPVFLLVEGNSVCSSNLAMEVHREVWGESGCELSSTGWKRTGIETASEAQAARISNAFAALPAPNNVCPQLDAGLPGFAGLSLEKLTAEGDSTWMACRLEDGGLAAPFDEAVAAMRVLGAAPP